MTQATEPITSAELDELLWENYYCLAATPIEAMRNAWEEIEDGTLPYWAEHEFGITIYDLISSLSRLAQQIVDAKLNPLQSAISLFGTNGLT